MSEVVTITIGINHILAVMIFAAFTAVALAPNDNDYYSYADRILGYVFGFMGASICGYLIF